MPLVYPVSFLGASQALGGACRFFGAESMSEAITSTSANRQRITLSVWIRPSVVDVFQPIFTVDNGPGGEWIGITSDNQMKWNQNSGGSTAQYIANDLVITQGEWQHLVWVLDTNQAANQNRVRFWRNGVQGTSQILSSQDFGLGEAVTFGINTLTHDIGWWRNGPDFFQGDMALLYYVDGQVLPVTDFADTIDGVYQAKRAAPSYGVNGAFISMQNPLDLGADDDNGNDYTLSGITAANAIGDGPPISY